jgi:hypothetical protein
VLHRVVAQRMAIAAQQPRLHAYLVNASESAHLVAHCGAVPAPAPYGKHESVTMPVFWRYVLPPPAGRADESYRVR